MPDAYFQRQSVSALTLRSSSLPPAAGTRLRHATHMYRRSIAVLGFVILLFGSAVASAQTIRDRLSDQDFRVYTVIFGLTVDAGSHVDSFHVSKVIDPLSGSTAAVPIQVPDSYVQAARHKAEARHYKPSLKDGKPVEFFTYYFYAPTIPAVVITDLDRPVESQP